MQVAFIDKPDGQIIRREKDAVDDLMAESPYMNEERYGVLSLNAGAVTLVYEKSKVGDKELRAADLSDPSLSWLHPITWKEGDKILLSDGDKVCFELTIENGDHFTQIMCESQAILVTSEDGRVDIIEPELRFEASPSAIHAELLIVYA